MKKQTKWIVVLIFILGLSSLACNAILGDDNEAEPTADSTIGQPAATEAAANGGESGGETTGGAA
ncbi:MAG: hypothetical protein WAM60_09040, partial [Candidatus Promineifilaceae bacterium]